MPSIFTSLGVLEPKSVSRRCLQSPQSGSQTWQRWRWWNGTLEAARSWPWAGRHGPLSVRRELGVLEALAAALNGDSAFTVKDVGSMQSFLKVTLRGCSLHRDREVLEHEHPCAKQANPHRNKIQDPKSVRDSSMAILGLRLQRKWIELWLRWLSLSMLKCSKVRSNKLVKARRQLYYIVWTLWSVRKVWTGVRPL